MLYKVSESEVIFIESFETKKDQTISCNLLDDIFYEELILNSNVLKSTIAKGATTLNSFDLLTNDIFNLLYKVVITFNNENNISFASLQNKPIIEYLFNSTILNKLRSRTKASLPNTAISIKYILDEVITKLRGSEKSKILKFEQQKLLNLYKKRNEINDILNHLELNDKNNELCNYPNNTDFPFNENIKSLLNQILQSELINNESYNLINLLETILTESKKIISEQNLINNKNEFQNDMEFNKSIYNALNNLKNNFSNDDTSSYENIIEDYLHNINNEINSSDNDSDNDTTVNEDDINSELNEESNTNDVFEEEFNNAIDYADEKLSIYKKTKYTLIKNLLSSLNKTDSLLELNDEDFDEVIIIDDFNNTTSKNTNEYLIINEENNATLNECYYDKPNNMHKNEQADNFNELIHFILNEVRYIDNKINFCKNSIKKQIENLNIDNVIDESIENIKQFDENIKLLNINKNSISSLSFDEIIRISKYFSNPEIKIFFDKVGRKKEIAKKASSKKKKDKTIVSDRILLSDDIDNIIDEELMMFSLDIEAFENDFYDRYLHNRLLTYEKVKSKEKNKGPIILCYDGSGSMDGNKIKETKVHILTFIEIAKIQKRKMITIQFASKDEPLIINKLNPNNININDIYDIMNNFLKGGTDFEKPLEKAIQYIEADKFKHADILFITDGVCNISQNFKKKFISTKEIMKFKLYSVIMHGNTYSDYGDIGEISDEVMEIKSINLNNWNEKISEKIFSI